MREPKPETVIRQMRRQAAGDAAQIRGLVTERNQYRARATKAEQEVAEWRQRFDALLRRDEATR